MFIVTNHSCISSFFLPNVCISFMIKLIPLYAFQFLQNVPICTKYFCFQPHRKVICFSHEKKLRSRQQIFAKFKQTMAWMVRFNIFFCCTQFLLWAFVISLTEKYPSPQMQYHGYITPKRGEYMLA